MDLAVLDALPLLRLGAVAALGGGEALASSDELSTWLSGRGPAVVVLGVHEDEEAGWALLASLHDHVEVRVVVLLAPFSVPTAASALRAGAAQVVPRDADAETLRTAVAEVRRGVVTLSSELLRVTTALARTGGNHAAVTDEQRAWLRALGQGTTVAALAQTAGLSERVMYRRLKLLYRRLGVSGRTQALMRGRDAGWL